MVASDDGECDDEDLVAEKYTSVNIEEDDEPVATRWSWLDLATITLCFGANVIHCADVFLTHVAQQVHEHQEYRSKNVDFADSVMRDVRRL